MRISDEVIYVGVNDHEVDLFEGMYPVAHGMAYNSYVILDEKIAVMDTVDAHFGALWLKQVAEAVGEREPEYLVIQHMEPDHSANIVGFMERYQNAVIVASAKAFGMMKQLYGHEYEDRRLIVGEGDALCLGSHTLQFIAAPMVHWPEVIMTYDMKEKILFSADGFGKFGALDVEEDWAREARRYYIGIVGKFGVQVQNLLKKAAALDIQTICPLHGPVLTENLGYYLNLYQTWSSYAVESEGVMIAYASVYGNTKRAAEELVELLHKKGCPKVALYDLARHDMTDAVAEAFCYGKLVLATITYNGGVFPVMREFISNLTERGYKNRQVAMIENATWAATAAKTMKQMLENSKNVTYLEPVVTIQSALNETSRKALETLADVLCKDEICG